MTEKTYKHPPEVRAFLAAKQQKYRAKKPKKPTTKKTPFKTAMQEYEQQLKET